MKGETVTWWVNQAVENRQPAAQSFSCIAPHPGMYFSKVLTWSS
jgi:hypothetical protein